MRKRILLLFVVLFTFMGGCSSSSEDLSGEKSVGQDAAQPESASVENNADYAYDQTESGVNADSLQNMKADRKIIYTGHLHIEVKDYDETFEKIETKMREMDGYIVNSTVSDEGSDETKHGEITVRIPQKNFQQFIDGVEDLSSRVLQNSITGEDVTEEYVDLNSRLKSKRAVEARLLKFLEQAEKTQDLLAISEDLAKVQEEIETIIGRMNYLENRSDLATITIYIQEKNVKITTLGEELNTWGQAKEQFKKSINFLLSFFSGLFVFIVGNLPILSLLGIAAAAVWIYIRKKRRLPNKNE